MFRHSWLTKWLQSALSFSRPARRKLSRRLRLCGERLEVRTLLSAGDIGFALGFGSTGFDIGQAIATDGANVYVTGYFAGTVDFDPGAGVTSLTSFGGDDAFVAKYSSTGVLVYVRHLGGMDNDQGYDIAVDGSGNVYTTGLFKGTADFDPGAGTSLLTSFGGGDTFVSKLDSAGNFVYARKFGGTLYSQGYGIAVDGSGNVYATGIFAGTSDFDPGAGTSLLTSFGFFDNFVTKLDSAGNFVYSRQLGGPGSERGRDIAVDGVGNVYTTGFFGGTADFDPGAGASLLTSFGSDDIYVSKLDSAGNFAWVRQLGGTAPDQSYGIALDGSGNIYTTGGFQGTADFDPGAGTNPLTSFGSSDTFVSKLDSAGNFVWVRQLGGTSGDGGFGIGLDGSGNVYTTGYFQDAADFDPGAGTSPLPSFGSFDLFVSKLDSVGNFVYARQLGGASGDFGVAIAVDSSENVYTTGAFQGTADFDPGAGTSFLTSIGGFDVFVSKLTGNTISQQIDILIACVDQLRQAGVINPGNTNALTAILENAKKSLANGNTNTAENQLNAFVNKVEAFRKSNRLTDAQANGLIVKADAIIASLL